MPLGIAAVLGGALGAVLLLLTPPGAFERMVPVLIAAASAAILVQRPPRELAAEGARAHAPHPGRDPRWLPAGVFAIGIYGGYFGAAAGVLMLAMFLLATGEGVPRSNALKNVVLGAGQLGRGAGLRAVRVGRVGLGAAAGDRAVHRRITGAPDRAAGAPDRAPAGHRRGRSGAGRRPRGAGLPLTGAQRLT